MLIYLKKTSLVIACLTLTFLLACKKKEPTLVWKGIQVATNANIGSILTDVNGRSLYFFASDVAGTANCAGACEITWPIYYSADVSTDTNLDATEVGVITRADGRKQSTYKGYPLYYYVNDAAEGDTKGDAIGGIWFVAKPDYSMMVANAQLVGANGKLYTSTLAEGTGNTKYFTDGKGRTLYAFAPDKNRKNTYTKSDLSNNAVWPVFDIELKSLPSTIAKDLVSVIDVFGKKQLTYKGWPLYYFGSDATRGNNKGVSVPQPGVWPVVFTTTPVAPAAP